jgi:hypothetical protein
MLALSIALSVGVAAESASANAPRGERVEKKARVAKKGKKAAKPKAKAEAAPKADDPPPPVDAPAPAESAPSSAPPAVDPVDTGASEGLAPDIRRNGPSRIEFDDRLIQGQTNKANAIYLFERRASELRTLVRTRKDYHREIDESLD